MNDIHADAIDSKSLVIIGINAIVALAAFIILYRKKGLENESNMAETIVISDNMIIKRRLRNHIGYAVFGV